MPESTFTDAIKQITSGAMGLGDLISVADGLTASGQRDLAEQAYEVWIKFNPEHPQRFAIHFNLSALQTKLGNEEQAERNLRTAVEINADFMPAYVNLGGVLERKGQLDEAVSVWRQGAARLELCTGDGVLHKTMLLKQVARVLLAHQQAEAAEASLLECLEVDASQADAIGQYIPIRQSHCKWPVIAPQGKLDHKTLMRAVQPLTMAAHTDDPMLLLAAAWTYVKHEVDEATGDIASDRRGAQTDLTGRRMRVGYISSDLRDHAIGYLMAELFEVHDKNAVEVFAYFCGGPGEGALTPRIRDAVEHWVDIRDLTDDQAAARIAADGIDVLVDVNGLTKDARTAIFARRPAPIQVNWLGFPGPMGSPYHQYIIADPWIIPPENELYYSEKVVRIPCYQSNDRNRVVAERRPTRSECGLPKDGFVFCCFNGAQKITRFTFDRWIEILSATPKSVLWLLESSKSTQERLSAYAEEKGVERSRIVYAPKLQNAVHLARYPLADLFLDTAPYGAHTTASDALWMGVPVLTLSGRSFASRVCGSLVRSAGLPEMVCLHPKDYVAKALGLAKDPSQLKALGRRLQEGRDTCDLFNMDKLVSELEARYRDMCEDHMRGLTPEPDLRNLETYLDIGAEEDHERSEMLAVEDYHGLYRSRLGRRHHTRPIPFDQRLWTSDLCDQTQTRAPVDSAPEADTPEFVRSLLQLRDDYDAASDLLCHPLTKSSEDKIQTLRVKASSVAVAAPEGTDAAGWEKHYRLLMDAIDPERLKPSPAASAQTEHFVLSSSRGRPIEWAALKETADRIGAEAVFFAAADETYIDLYGRLFVQSILNHSDVRALVVIHAIGGAEKLQTIARSIGVEDDRFIVSGDRFDAQAVATKCFDSPPKGLSDKPIAHFQSARFMALGPFLTALKRPIFVSDIDLILQRGVLDLLERTKKADLVLNEHHGSQNAGSRLTANLLLLYPTANAALFVNFLHGYLETMLARPEVTRWIDQFGLLMARHFITARLKSVKIEYFDTTSDINNVIYKSFQENPFRFLSLYHGFDLSSLRERESELARRTAAE